MSHRRCYSSWIEEPEQMNNANDLKAYLETHCLGRSAAQTAEQIRLQVKTTDARTLRKLAKQLRYAGEPICSHASDGYWWAETTEDLKLAIGFLKGRALNSLKQVGQLKKIAFPNVAGQMSLDLPEPLLVEIPEALHAALQRYQAANPDKTSGEVFQQALRQYLAQHKAQEKPCDG